MENNKTFSHVIQQLIETNDKLIAGKITVEQARQIAQDTQVIINGAKVMVEFMKFKGMKESSFFSETTLQLEKNVVDKKEITVNNIIANETEKEEQPEMKEAVKEKKVKKMKEKEYNRKGCKNTFVPINRTDQYCLKHQKEMDIVKEQIHEADNKKKEKKELNREEFLKKVRKNDDIEDKEHVIKSIAVEPSCDYCLVYPECIKKGFKNQDITKDCPVFKLNKEKYEDLYR